MSLTNAERAETLLSRRASEDLGGRSPVMLWGPYDRGPLIEGMRDRGGRAHIDGNRRAGAPYGGPRPAFCELHRQQDVSATVILG